MLFNSLDYIFFLFIVYLVIRSDLLKKSHQHIWLLLASLFFYAYWNPIHIFILLYSGVTDFHIGNKIFSTQNPSRKKKYLYLSITNNLGLLFIFKYLSSITDSFNEVLAYFNWPFSIHTPEIILPIGISFFTFQTMSYAIDIYRGSLKPVKSKVKFMLYVSFFPQLVAGPILRASNFIPQLKNKFKWNETFFFTGVFFILLGLFKKVCLADPIGVYIVDPVYFEENTRSSLDIVIANYAYLFQVFYDFSGYSDIAMGSALILGYKMPHNFDSPLFSVNPSQFWDRWHISLSHWVRDYLYYPLCISKGRMKGRLHTNLFISIVIIGIWHGSSLTYLYFGLFHATLAISHRHLNRYLKKIKLLNQNKFGIIIKWFVFFQCLTIGAIFFRSKDTNQVAEIWKELLFKAPSPSTIITKENFLLLCVALLLHTFRAKKLDQIAQKFSSSNVLAKIVFTWLIILPIAYMAFVMQGKQAFIYFQF